MYLEIIKIMLILLLLSHKEDLKKVRIFNQCLKNILKNDFLNDEFKNKYINKLKQIYDSKNKNIIYV